jgi:hypothetical protein
MTSSRYLMLLLLIFAATPAGAEPLRVDIKPATVRWRPKQRVSVALKITNTTKTMQTFTAWSCSWGDQWRSNDTALTWDPWDCDKNAPTPVGLAPGRSRTWKLDMFAIDTAKLGTHSVRMTFTPEGGGKTLTSNAIAITVVK